jgi:hypothetical protein
MSVFLTANILDTINATATSTGALKVTGGVGIGKDLYVGGTSNITSTTANQLILGYNDSNKINFDVSSGGDLTIDSSGNDINFANTDIIRVVNTSNSTSVSTGGLVISGGVGIAKDVFIDGYINIDNSVENHQSFVGLDASHTTFIASMKDNLDADYARGSRFVTLTSGSVSITNGKLVLGSGNDNYVRYSAVGNASFTQQGAFRFKITPNYSGTPITNLVAIIKFAISTNNNDIFLSHSTTGYLILRIYNTTGGTIFNTSMFLWSPIAGTEYEMEIDMDISNGATRLFIDGIQCGATITTTGIRNSGDFVQIGSMSSYGVLWTSNFSMRDLEIFDNVQHTTDYQISSYTPDYSLQNAITTYGLNASGPANLANLNVEGQQEVKFMASFASTLNADYGLGSTLVATTAGSVAITNGKLVLGTGAGNYVRYSAQGNADMTQSGTIKFKITPNYSGIPTTNTGFIGIGTTDVSTNSLYLFHRASNGNFSLAVYNSSNSKVINDVGFAAWSPVAGTEYEIELNCDFTAGMTNLFINGVKQGSGISTTLVRTTANLSVVQIGGWVYTPEADLANYSMRDLIIYNTVQHTANYTPGYSTESIYTTHISGPAKILGQTIMSDVNLTGRIDSYNSNNLMRSNFSNITLGTRAVSTWTTRTSNSNQWKNVCWSAELGIFCAVSDTGTGNRVMTSSDGINWTTQVNPVDNAWQDVCWSPELGIFCAVSSSDTGNVVMTSPDGITWTTTISPANNGWYSVCWSPELGIFCAVADTGSLNRVMTSPDGITWTTRTSNDNTWKGICWSPELGLFCAVSGGTGTGNRVMTSPDGITWTTRASAADMGWWGICWSPELGLFSAISTTGTVNSVMTSPDGINWTIRICAASITWRRISWSAELGLFCAVGESASGNGVMTSPDGIIWTTRSGIVNNAWVGVCWSSELGIFCAVSWTGSLNRIMTSKQVYDSKSRQYIDGIVNLSSSVNSSSTTTGALVVSGGVGIGGSLNANGNLSIGGTATFGGNLALGTNNITSVGSITASSNLITTLTETSSSTATGALRVAGGAGLGSLYVNSTAVISGTTQTTSTSTGTLTIAGGVGVGKNLHVGYSIDAYNGNNLMRSNFSNTTLGTRAVSTWTTRASASTNSWFGICWSAELGLFCSVSTAGSVMTSSDGITWTTRASAVANQWWGVCWSPELGLFCATSITGTGNRVMTSPDGITWTTRTTTDNTWREVCWSPELGLFCAVASAGTSGTYVMTSPDGITWTTRTTPVNNQWIDVCWSPELGLFCATSITGTGNRVMTSPDGITWTTRASAVDNEWRNICWSPELGLFCAVSTSINTSGAMTSPDGITWTIRTTPNTNRWTGLSWSPELGLFCAVAYSGTANRIMTSLDGIVWTERSAPTNGWENMCWSPELGIFCAISSGTGNTVMTSKQVYDTKSRQYIDGIVNMVSSVNSTSSLTGALTVIGGVGMGGSLNANGNLSIGGTATFGGNLTMGTNNITSVGSITSSSNLITTLTETSSSTTTGALRVAGGAGLGSLYVNSTAVIAGTTQTTSTSTGTLTIAGGVGIGKNIHVGYSIDAYNGNNLMRNTFSNTTLGTRAVSTWTTRVSAANNEWMGMTWSPELGLFCAVSRTGTLNRVMTSSDGINWTTRTTTAETQWNAVCWSPELGIFCAVAGTGTGNRIMTSPDGIIWTTRASAADNEWWGICWSPELGLFCAVARTAVTTGTYVMTSPDGITWTTRTSPTNAWWDVCWSAELGLFCAVAGSGTLNRVMTSPDGIVWTNRTTPVDRAWRRICWAPELGLFCSVADIGTGVGSQIMTSPDGINWTSRTNTTNISWRGISWSPELGIFCAVAYAATTSSIMTSLDGITWTSQASVATNAWHDVCWSPELGIFCAVAYQATAGTFAMTSRQVYDTKSRQYIDGIVNMVSSVNSTSTITGALTVIGGVGIGGNLSVGGNTTISGTTTMSGNLALGTNNITSVGSITASSNLITTLTEISSSTSTGALRVAGGAGLGSLYVNSTTVIAGTTQTTSTSTGTLTIAGGVGIGKNLSVGYSIDAYTDNNLMRNTFSNKTLGTRAVSTWTTRTTNSNAWFPVCWSAELGIFCSISVSGSGNRVMTSPDGVIWTTRVSAADYAWWGVCWSPELGLFCAVSQTANTSGVMTSPDGITWTTRTTVANQWNDVCWSPELGIFCAVATSGTTNRVMTSPDGITWTTQNSVYDIGWRKICWSAELSLFCVVSDTATGANRVLTSPDGINWTTRASAAGLHWRGLCWAAELGLFCASAYTLSVNSIMTSLDGITWTLRTTPNTFGLHDVCWSPDLGLFCAVSNTASTANRVLTSPDGIIWTTRASASNNSWYSVCWSPELGIFCSVSITANTGVMTSRQVYDTKSRQYIDGIVNMVSSVNSTSTITGALTVIGGVGMGGSLNANGNLSIGGTATFGGNLTMGTNNITSVGSITATSNLITTLTETSSSTDTGALRVAGGAGLGSLYVNSTAVINGTTQTTSTSTGTLTIAGGMGVGKNLNVGYSIDAYNGNELMRNTFSNKTLGTRAVSTWTTRASASTNSWFGICWSAELGLFCSVSTAGSVMTSSDGITWTTRTSAANNVWFGVCWSEELGIFCAVSSSANTSGVMTSPDGITWTTRTTVNNNWRGITWSPELGLFCAVASSGTAGTYVMTSLDGITWTTRTTPVNNQWVDVCWSPELGLFCATSITGTGNRVMTSPDGIVWTTRASVVDNEWRNICWSAELGIFCAVSTSTNTSGAMTSPDGITWTTRLTPNTNRWTGLSWSPELGLFCAVAYSGTANRIMTSPDGFVWTERSAPTNGWENMCWSPELGIFCAISSGTGNTVMTSKQVYDTKSRQYIDGIVNMVSSVDSTSSSTGALTVIGGVGIGGSLNANGNLSIGGTSTFGGNLALGTNNITSVGSITASSNLITTLTETSSSTATGALRVAGGAGLGSLYVNSTAVIAGTTQTTSTSTGALTISGGVGIGKNLSVGYSIDAYNGNELMRNTFSNKTLGTRAVSTWTTRVSATDNEWISVSWSPELGLFCAVSRTGTGNRVMTSPDGINWTTRSSATDNYWSAICWSAELGLFCVVASSGVGNRVMTSPDGITWTTRTSNDNQWEDVCWSQELGFFCAVSTSGTGNRVMTSPDGITWTTQTSATDNGWRGVCWSPELGLFCAISNSGTTNLFMTSSNGITWTTRTSATGTWIRIRWAAELGLFCALSSTGTPRVVTSSDGITWISRTTSTANNWTNLCWSPELGLFCVVGLGSTLMTSPDAITWSTQTIPNQSWYGIIWSAELGIFCATAISGTGNRVMTSKQVYDTKSRQYIDGIVSMVSSVNSTSTTTGALTVIGGVGIGGNLSVGGSTTISGTTTLNGNLAMGVNDITTVRNITSTGIISTTTTLKTTDSTVATSTSTGALQVIGGAGIGGAIYPTGVIIDVNTTQATTTSTGALIINGGVGIAKNVYVDGYTNIDNSVENHQSFVGLDVSHTTFIASYKDNLDADYARGSRYVTLTNGTVSVTNGKLTLGTGTDNYVRYSAVSNANFTQQGTIKFKYTPNYATLPGSDTVIFNAGVDNSANGIWLYHKASNANIVLYIKSSSGGNILLDVPFGQWIHKQYQEYEFELNIDISNGATRLFIDGKQFGPTLTTTGIRTNTSTIIQIGSWLYGAGRYSNFSMRDLEIFDSVQHTTDYQVSRYTPDYSLQNAITTYGLNASGPANLANLNVEGQQEVKFTASFASSINADYGLGSTLVVTTAGSVAITNGKLVLGSGAGNYIRYSAKGNADFTQAGAIKFKLTPNYSGIPTANTGFVGIGKTGSRENEIFLFHYMTSGNLALDIYKFDGSPLVLATTSGPILGAWLPVAGTEYEFEVNFDFTIGATRLFINGTLQGSALTQTGVRTNTGQLLQIGDDVYLPSVFLSNFSMRDLIIYNTVQHTANYTPGYSTESIYTTHISGPAKILGQTIMGDVHLTGRIDSYNSNNLMRNTFSNSTLGTRAVSTWTTRVTPSGVWLGVCWSPELGLFCSAAGTQVITSSDGINWTLRSSPANNQWFGICWSPELGLFCTVSTTGSLNRVMTSPDGITWTTRTSNDNQWEDVCWSPELGLFCAVAITGTGNRVMTSPDGITWTTRTTNDNNWSGICWSPELGIFCAIANGAGTGNRVMTSPDGITWTTRASAADIFWDGICWAPELGIFCAVAASGTGNRVMTSLDGITWTIRTSAPDYNWRSVCWSPELGLFCSVATTGSGSNAMTSPDGIVWTVRTTASQQWRSVCWSPELGIFCAVADSGTSNRVMTSKHVLNTTTRQMIDGIVSLSSSVGSTSSTTGALVVNGGIGMGGAISAYNDGGLYYKAYDSFGGSFPWNAATGRILQCGITTTLNLTTPNFGGQTTNVMARIMGWIKPLYTETYTFELTAPDDTAILFIDNREIVRSTFPTTATGTIALIANRWVPIYIEWYNGGGPGKLQVQWSSTTQTKQDIPAANMRYNQFDNAPSVLGTSIVNGIMTITRTDSTTSTSTGGLVVSGGVGIAKDLYVDGYTNIDNSVENHQSFVGLDASHTTFIASYKDNMDADYARGSRYVTLTNGTVSVTNGKLVLGTGTNNYIRYSAVSNANFTQQGTIRFKLTPNYSGFPGINTVFVNVGSVSVYNNLISLIHLASNGNLQLVVYNSSVSPIFITSLGAWIQTSGTEYEFEFDMDLSNGATRLFIDGKQFGSTVTTIGIRTNTSTTIQVGDWLYSTGAYSNFSMRDLEIFDSVQHTTDYQTNKYTPNYSLQSALTTYGLNASGPTNLANLNVEGQQEVKFMASFASSLNADYGLGSTLVAVTSGTVAITNGKLVFGNSGGNYIRYDAKGNADFTQAGTIKFKLTPNYSGIPSPESVIFNIGNIGNYNNAMWLYHATSGNLVLQVNKFDAGSIINQAALGIWNPTSGIEYEFELDIDITLGATRLFVNGIQFGATQTATGTRTNTSTIIQISDFIGNLGAYNGNFAIRDLIIYNTVQHTSNYTPGYSTESIYTTHISGPAKILGSTIMGDVHLTGRIDSYNSNNLMRNTFSNSTLGTRAVSTWTTRVSAADNVWYGMCWSPELGLFCAVSGSSNTSGVMTSSDGINWTTRTTVANNWTSINWSAELGIFCAVAATGTGNRVMTSPDGITWTTRASAADNTWWGVCWSPELGIFCAVSTDGTGNRVMTSPNGITWTTRASAADNTWWDVCWSPELGLFCAVAASGTGTRVMTSPDGITWTTRTSAIDRSWRRICWSPELMLFCAVADTGSGIGSQIMTSPDGITWTSRTNPVNNNWRGIVWAPELGLFCAIAYTAAIAGTLVMTSPDGIVWTTRTNPVDNGWHDLVWSPELGIFCSVAYTGAGNRVMTSKQVYDTKSRQYIDGIVSIVSSVNSLSSSTGALTINSGIGIVKDLAIGGNTTIAGTTSLNGNLVMGINDITSIGDITSTGIITTSSTLKTTDPTTASSTSTGAFQVTGGIGIGGALYVGGAIVNSITTQSTSISTGGLILSGGVGIAKDVFIDGYTNIDNSVENHQSFIGLDASHITFIASYKDNLAADYARGSRYVTATNGNVTLSNGKLTLGSGTGNYVKYSAVGNATFTQQGTIKFKITPNYSGAPSTVAGLFGIGENGQTLNTIYLAQRTSSGNITLLVRDSLGNIILLDTSFGSWNPTAGTEYEFELNCDFTSGIIKLYINGNQFGSTLSARCKRNTSGVTSIQIGGWVGSSLADGANFSIRDIEIFDNIQHTSDYQTNKYTPDYSLQNAITTYGLNASGPTNLAILNVEGQQEVKFMASYASSINADYGLGSTLVAATAGTVSITNGKLVLGAGTGNYVRYSAQGNADMTQTGAIKFKLTPNYSGAPTAPGSIFFNNGIVSSINNTITIFHENNSGTGNLRINIYAFDGAPIIATVILGAWSPVAGTEYEFEFNFDITAGATRLFIDGVQFGSTLTATGVRTNISTTIQIGDWIHTGGWGANFSMRDLIIYNTVQHTADYTPGYSTESIYTTHISGPSKILGQTIMSDVHLTGRIDSYNSNNLMRSTFSNTTLGNRAVTTWTTRTSAADNSWRSVCWSSELGMFCAVASSGTGNRVMTSPDGITWTSRTSIDSQWEDVCWSPELGLFCAVSISGITSGVITSPDGITWTSRTTPTTNPWYSVCWSAELGLFCSVGWVGTGNRVMTSPDGITWTTRASAADNNWREICWSPELSLFCAIAESGTGNRVMTSSDGLTWITRASAANNSWDGICWSAETGLFCAVAWSGTGNRVMTSPDGITWTTRANTVDNNWNDVCWSPEFGLFIAVADVVGTGNRVMTSPDGITWTTRSTPDNNWHSICWSDELGIFCAVAYTGTGNRVMTSRQVTDTKSRQYIDGIVSLSSSVGSTSSTTGALVVNGGIGVGGAISAYNDGGLYYKAYDNYNIPAGTIPWNMATGRILQTGITTTLNITNPTYGGQGDYVALRIMGWIQPQYSETYTFELTATDDTAILFIDNREVVRANNTTATGTIILVAGRWVPIYIEWLEAGGASKLQVQWLSSTQTKQDIPASRMRYNQFDNAPSVLGTSIVNGIMTITRTDSTTSTSSGALVVNGGVGIGGNCHIGGTLVKGGGSFVIPHPDPSKTDWKLRHCFVESNTRGDNIYRYKVRTTNKTATIQLPNYFKHINENPQVWVIEDQTDNDNIGFGKGKVDDKLETVTIKVNEEGTYNIMIIGTRKDPLMIEYWDQYGAEIPPQ